MSGDQSRVFCTLCRREFSISHGGENDLKQHAGTELHKRATQNKGASNITKFFASSTIEQDRVATCEVTSVYHTVKHGLSYNSMDCSNKLNSAMFSDSNTAKKMQCGRTKAEMIAMNVLAPKTVRDILKELNPPPPPAAAADVCTCAAPVYFSVATDASNKGNRKMFPVCLRYFNQDDGVQSKLLDFYEDSDESASGIHNAIIECLTKYELKTACITSYAADNANVNYGKHHSVYQLLQSDNSHILRANCPAHVAHNACKHACDQLSVDIETMGPDSQSTLRPYYAHF